MMLRRKEEAMEEEGKPKENRKMDIQP